MVNWVELIEKNDKKIIKKIEIAIWRVFPLDFHKCQVSNCLSRDKPSSL